MFRLSHRALNAFGGVLKQQSKFIEGTKHSRIVSKFEPTNKIRVAYSTDASQGTKPPQSPLTSLISKDGPKEPSGENPEEPDQKENREQSWRRMKYTFMIFGASFTCVGIYLVVELGKPRQTERGDDIHDEYTSMNVFKAYVLRTINELNYYRQLIKEPSREKLLPDIIRHPYYSPQYTLVLEFTDVVVHPEWTYTTGWRFKKRPELEHFLQTLNGTYEIVIYTAEQGMTVFPIVEALDPKNYINYKLVRDATLFEDGKHVKDISKLNRDLKKTIVVDWNGDSTNHPENVFKIPRWGGGDDDRTMVHLASFLMTISQNEIEDVRDVLRYYNQFDDPLETFKERQKTLIETKGIDDEVHQIVPPIKRWSPSFIKKM